MSVRIKQINDKTILVNNKVIVRDMEGVWVSKAGELKPSEERELNNFLKAIKDAQEA